jgi:hypothetical protein
MAYARDFSPGQKTFLQRFGATASPAAALSLSLLLILLTAGCAAPRYGLDPCLTTTASAAAGEATFTSLRYRVRTDAGRAAAQEVGRFMERAAALWTPLFGVPDPKSLPLEVRLHRDPASLAALLASQQLNITATGLYLPTTQPPAIHVACLGSEPGHPYRTLLHEGTHQFVHLGAGFRDSRPGTATPPRLALPLWLNEGLATYYEAAFVTPDLLQPGRPAPGRLAELQATLRRGKTPLLAATLGKRYGDSFTSSDYAIAWGVVYALLQEAPPPWASGGREWLQALIDESRRGWPLPAGEPAPDDRGQRWWTTVTDRTHTALQHYLAANGLTLPAWEAQWREWILAHP